MQRFGEMAAADVPVADDDPGVAVQHAPGVGVGAGPAAGVHRSQVPSAGDVDVFQAAGGAGRGSLFTADSGPPPPPPTGADQRRSQTPGMTSYDHEESTGADLSAPPG